MSTMRIIKWYKDIIRVEIKTTQPLKLSRTINRPGFYVIEYIDSTTFHISSKHEHLGKAVTEIK